MSDHIPEAEVIATGIKKGVKESRLRLTDRRVVFIALFVVAFCLLTTLWQQRQTDQVKQAQHAAKIACQQTNVANAKFNAVLNQLFRNASNSTALTPAQKAQAKAVYSTLHLAIVDCSKLAGQ